MDSQVVIGIGADETAFLQALDGLEGAVREALSRIGVLAEPAFLALTAQAGAVAAACRAMIDEALSAPRNTDAAFGALSGALERTLEGLAGRCAAFSRRLATLIDSGEVGQALKRPVEAALGALKGERVLNVPVHMEFSVASNADAAGRSAGQALVRAAADGAKGGQSLLRAAGTNAGSAFLQGLASRRGAILQTARGIAQAVAATMRSALRIQSPSKVMLELGLYTGEGFELGLKQSLNRAVRTADGLVKAGPFLTAGTRGAERPRAAEAAAQPAHITVEAPVSLAISGRTLARTLARETQRAQALEERRLQLGVDA